MRGQDPSLPSAGVKVVATAREQGHFSFLARSSFWSVVTLLVVCLSFTLDAQLQLEPPYRELSE
jgi:hypothetical protein